MQSKEDSTKQLSDTRLKCEELKKQLTQTITDQRNHNADLQKHEIDPSKLEEQIKITQEQLNNHEEALRLIEERISGYVSEQDVPLQLVKQQKEKQKNSQDTTRKITKLKEMRAAADRIEQKISELNTEIKSCETRIADLERQIRREARSRRSLPAALWDSLREQAGNIGNWGKGFSWGTITTYKGDITSYKHSSKTLPFDISAFLTWLGLAILAIIGGIGFNMPIEIFVALSVVVALVIYIRIDKKAGRIIFEVAVIALGFLGIWSISGPIFDFIKDSSLLPDTTLTRWGFVVFASTIAYVTLHYLPIPGRWKGLMVVVFSLILTGIGLEGWWVISLILWLIVAGWAFPNEKEKRFLFVVISVPIFFVASALWGIFGALSRFAASAPDNINVWFGSIDPQLRTPLVSFGVLLLGYVMVRDLVQYIVRSNHQPPDQCMLHLQGERSPATVYVGQNDGPKPQVGQYAVAHGYFQVGKHPLGRTFRAHKVDIYETSASQHPLYQLTGKNFVAPVVPTIITTCIVFSLMAVAVNGGNNRAIIPWQQYLPQPPVVNEPLAPTETPSSSDRPIESPVPEPTTPPDLPTIVYEVHEVQQGDQLKQIAVDYRVKMQCIIDRNRQQDPNFDPDSLVIGQRLEIPVGDPTCRRDE